MDKINTKLIILTIIFLVFFIPAARSIPSQDSFYSIGSDFLVLQTMGISNVDNPGYKSYPQIYALYDNTKISIDVNNDGAIDYEFIKNKGGPYSLTFDWELISGSKIHADKPIIYHQEIFLNVWKTSSGLGRGQATRSISVPPCSNYKNEYLILQGKWHFITDNLNQTIYIDENIDGTINYVRQLNKSSSLNVDINNFSRVYSSKSFFGYSWDSLAGPLSNDFLTGSGVVRIIVLAQDTTVTFDYNVDTTPDYFITLSIGEYLFNTTYGARITSDKNISIFDLAAGFGAGYPIYPPATLSKTATNEFIVASKGSGENIIWVFNNFSAENINNSLLLYSLTDNNATKYTNISSNTRIPLLLSGLYFAYSTLPMTEYYSYSYVSSTSPAYHSARNIFYKKIYMTTNPKSKFVTPNSTVIMNVRVFNPFNDTTVSDIKIKFPINNFFSMPVASVNARKASLKYDGGDYFSKAVTLITDNNENYFLFEYDETLEPESFLDIDFSLSTPSTIGINEFQEATLTYSAPTWIN